MRPLRDVVPPGAGLRLLQLARVTLDRAVSEPTLSQPPSPPSRVPRVRELRVLFSTGTASPQRVILGDQPVVVGREAGARGISIDDRRVSRVHLVVERDGEGEGWTVVDRGSRNGIFVDGLRVARTPLRPGGVLRVGGAILMLVERDPRDELAPPSALAGDSEAMRVVRGEIRMAATRALPVLVTGETGAGKELVAAELHRLSGRPGAFVPVNCAAISPAVAESELFGHVAGAFTGAVKRGEGLWAAADRGTLFLDEIGELAPELQAKLLRALELGEVRPVGATQTTSLDVRIVSATNRDLDAEIAAGRFRADLLARLAAWRIDVPPLRDHREDILTLASLFLAAAGPALALTPDTAEALVLADWPWNARELKQTVTVAAARAAASGDPVLGLAHLPVGLQSAVAHRVTSAVEAPPVPPDADDAPPPVELLTRLLIKHGCNVAAVAREVGKERRQVYRWIERYRIDLAELRRRP